MYTTAKATGTRPSQLVQINDPWLGLQFDQATIFVGTVIENASQEMRNAGTQKAPKYVPRYRMDQLLDPEFRLPAPPTKEERERGAIASLKALKGVKSFKVLN